MRHSGLLLSFLVVSIPAQTATAQQKRIVTPEDIVDIRTVSDANISPDGKRIAFVVGEPGDSNNPDNTRHENIWTVPVDGSEPARLFASSPRNEDAPRWSPDGRWLAFLSDRGEDNQKQIWLMRADSGNAEKLTNAKAGVDSFKWSRDSKMIAFLARDANTEEEQKKQERHDDVVQVDHDYKYLRLWVVGLNDRKSAIVTQQNVEVVDFDWSPDTESFAIAFTSIPGLFKNLTVRLAEVRRSDGEFLRKLADDVTLLAPFVRWSPDGTTLLFLESSPRKSGYWMSLVDAGGGPVRPLLKAYPGTFWLCQWAPDSKHLLAEAIVGTRIKLLQIDVGTGEVSTLANILNSGGDMTASADGRTFAFVAEREDSPADVWSFTTGQLPRQLTNFNPQIASLKLGNVSDVTWTNSKDGQALYGVLVTPADFKSGNPYPTIVEVHPGNDAWWFGWQGSWWQWAQLLASNGYAIFLPNSRGSTGQGWDFGEFFHIWIPDAAFDDIMDGIDSLIEQKIADPNRLGIGGWSTGGFMTAWAITHTNRFKAAVPFGAPVDLELSWGGTEIGGLFEATLGDTPLRNRQLYEAHSPIHFVQNCRTPTLILQGETDPGVPIAEAYTFYHALKALGVETEMVVYPREGHSIEERAHQIDFQMRVLAWYDKHLK